MSQFTPTFGGNFGGFLSGGQSRLGFAGHLVRVVTSRLGVSARPKSRMADLERRVQQLNYHATPLPPRCPRPQGTPTRTPMV